MSTYTDAIAYGRERFAQAAAVRAYLTALLDVDEGENAPDGLDLDALRASLTPPPEGPLKPLDKLPNGATVIAVKPAPRYDNSESKGAVVLAVWRQPAEYVTWVCADNGDGTTWGHYFDSDVAAAAQDFATR